MGDVITFNNLDFGIVRATTINDEPFFLGKDVATALGYSNYRDAINKHVDIQDRGAAKCDTLGGQQEMVFINESGVYSLVFGSKLRKAREFRNWVTREVIPSIRKNGGYIAGQETMTDEELLAKALMVAQNKIAEKDKVIQRQQMTIEEQKPKAIFADAVATSKTSILIGELAKIITQNGFSIGQNRLFDWMREKGYLIKFGDSRNMPMQRYVEQGLFEIKESSIQNPDGSVRITRTPKVTGKGQIYFINKFIGARAV